MKTWDFVFAIKNRVAQICVAAGCGRVALGCRVSGCRVSQSGFGVQSLRLQGESEWLWGAEFQAAG